MSYQSLLERRRNVGADHGFEPHVLPDAMFPFQRDLTEWAIRKGRAALFADCGLGKTLMQLAWADNVVRETGRPVLILTPLAVSHQLMAEGSKFGIPVGRVDGRHQEIVTTNYQKLHQIASPGDFAGIVLDESSILKSFSGATRQALTQFMARIPYRLLCTATAAPNDHTELGTSSEALGYLGYIDMLARFFRSTQGGNSAQHRQHGVTAKWRFKGHAATPFWRWVCSWAMAIRAPSDMGYADGDFVLPDLIEREHVVKSETPPEGWLFPTVAANFQEERAERRRTIRERCERAAELVEDHESSIIWCHLNDEGNLLEKMIPQAVQVSGSDSEEHKEESLRAFADGSIKRLVTKPKIGAWGLNLQRCAHIVTFASHSYEQHYQAVRRCWRFGQRRPVTLDVVTSEGETSVMENMRRKARDADRMFAALVAEMHNASVANGSRAFNQTVEVPQWLRTK